jgi:tetratricopeptide (TPR) repeat protein
MASSIERSAGNVAAALTLIEEVRRREESAGLTHTDDHAQTLFLNARAYLQAGRYREADAAASASARTHAESGFDDSSTMANTQLIRGRIQREGGRPDRALALFEAELARHEQRGGDVAALQVLQWDRGMALLLLGRADAALPVVRAARDAALERQDAGTARAASATLADVLVESGQLRSAMEALDFAAGQYAKAREEGAYTARNFLFAQFRYALAAGNLDLAAASLQEARGILSKVGNPEDPAWRDFNECAAKLALRRSRLPEALRFAESALAAAEAQALDPGVSVFIAEDLALLGAVKLAQGNPAEARAAAQRALDIYRKVAATGRAGFDAATLLARN